MATLQDGRILVYGGFCKEKAKKGKKEDEGKTMADMYLLVPDSELIIILQVVPSIKAFKIVSK